MAISYLPSSSQTPVVFSFPVIHLVLSSDKRIGCVISGAMQAYKSNLQLLEMYMARYIFLECRDAALGNNDVISLRC
jgi:hypothetical protein